MVAPNNNPSNEGEKTDTEKLKEQAQIYVCATYNSMQVAIQSMLCPCSRCKIVYSEASISIVVMAAAEMACMGKPEMLDDLITMVGNITKKYNSKGEKYE